MSGESTPAAVAPQPLLPLLEPPVDTDEETPAASRCCGGGACSMG